MKLHKTLNALESNTKTAMIGLLNARLADGIDLALATKQAHWNVKGLQFIAVHEMLDKLRTDLDESVDTMAERITALGGTALGTTQTTAKTSTLEPYPTDISTIEDHLRALIERVGKTANVIRENVDTADEAGDAGTCDLFTQMSRDLDKWLWFLEAHLNR